jgi:hypothetical protein
VSFIMTVINTVIASVLGCLLLSSGALGLGRSLAQKEGDSGSTNVSSAKCTVVSIGFSEGKNQDLIVSAGALCFSCVSALSLHGGST